MATYTPEQQKRLDRIKKVAKEGLIAVLKMVDELDAKIEKTSTLTGKLNTEMQSFFNDFKDRNIPSLEEITNQLRNDPIFIGSVQSGEKYNLTNDNIEAIASIASEKVTPPKPVIIEKTTKTIVKEVPVINNFTKTEIKEVALHETAEALRNKLESLPEGHRLSAKFIDDLEEILLALFKKNYNKQSDTVVIGGGASTGGRIVKYYDLSDQLNGVLKTFALPANWRVLQVTSSSTPGILRPTTDYTSTPQSITFTSEITAATTLAAGQTVMILYSE